MHLQSTIVLAGLPVPEPQAPLRVTRGQELSIWTEFEPACVASRHVPIECLFPVQFEITLGIIDDNLIVHALPCEVLSIRVHSRGGNRVHVGFGDVLGDDGDAELPHIDFLVIGGRDKAPAMLDKRQGVD